MKTIKIEMIIEKYKDDMPEIIKGLKEKYKPKQIMFYECEWFQAES